MFCQPRPTEGPVPDKSDLVLYSNNWSNALWEMTGLIGLLFLNNVLMSVGVIYYTAQRIQERHDKIRNEWRFPTFPIEDAAYNNIRYVINQLL